jgi:hypothetical protein
MRVERLQGSTGAAGRGFTRVAACVLALFALAAHATETPAPAPALLPEAVQQLQPAAAQPLRHAKMADLAGAPASAGVRHIANWAVHSGDHRGLPFVVVDKVDGRLFVFDAQGRLRGATPALVGSARGDESVPGIGNRPLSSIRPEEKTTPAGRFPANAGKGPKGEDILWVDYEGGVAIHRVVTSAPKERRLQRLASNVPQDRRITYGCINVPASFYDTVVLPMFKETVGVVYVLPEVKKPQDLFGSYEVAEEAAQQAAQQPVAPLQLQLPVSR